MVEELNEIEEFFKQFENPDPEKSEKTLPDISSGKYTFPYTTGDFFYTTEDFSGILDIIKAENILGIPVHWPLDSEKGKITLPFGHNEQDPFSGKPWFHTAIDIASNAGANILTTANGVVSAAGYDVSGHYGNYIVINHDFGISAIYTHLKEVKVEPDQLVKQGEIIGLIGNTGLSTGPHLHYAISLTPVSFVPGEGFDNALYVDPMKLMIEERL